MKLIDHVESEMSKIDWTLLQDDKNSTPQAYQIDMRKWTVFTQSKAIYDFVTSNYKVDAVANGVFQNTTNFTPPSPHPTDTTDVDLETESPRIKSHLELYDILLPFSRGVAEEPMIDFFQRIFRDWLGVLEIGCGQDATSILPNPPTGTNLLPPYFHSTDGGTLPDKAFQFPHQDFSVYPVDTKNEKANGVSDSYIPVPPLPPETLLGDVNEFAPDLESGFLPNPKPLDYKYPQTSSLPALEVPLFATFPTFHTNALLCYSEMQALAEDGKIKTFRDSWDVISKWIVATLNESVVTPGGITGYCYGVPANVWTGSVIGSISWKDV